MSGRPRILILCGGNWQNVFQTAGIHATARNVLTLVNKTHGAKWEVLGLSL